MSRFKRILRYFVLIMGALIAAALLVNAIFVWQTGNQLQERLGKLRAAGEPLSL